MALWYVCSLRSLCVEFVNEAAPFTTPLFHVGGAEPMRERLNLFQSLGSAKMRTEPFHAVSVPCI